MKQDNSSIYGSTTDLSLAATLVTLGFQIHSIQKNLHSKAVFNFEQSTKLNQTIEAYWADRLVVNPKSFFDVIKHIKTRLYSE